MHSGGNKSSLEHPENYKKNVPHQLYLALWDLYKAVHWEPTFERSAHEWGKIAVERIKKYNQAFANTPIYDPNSEQSIRLRKPTSDFAGKVAETLNMILSPESAFSKSNNSSKREESSEFFGNEIDPAVKRARARWGKLTNIEVNGVKVEVYGATPEKLTVIKNSLSVLYPQHISQVPRIVVGDRVGPIGRGKIKHGGNSAAPRDNRALHRLEITNYALGKKLKKVGDIQICFTLLHEVGHWVDWGLRIYPSKSHEQQTLEEWFQTLDYSGVTQGRGERSAEAYWRYFTRNLPEGIQTILESSPAWQVLESESEREKINSPASKQTIQKQVEPVVKPALMHQVHPEINITEGTTDELKHEYRRLVIEHNKLVRVIRQIQPLPNGFPPESFSKSQYPSEYHEYLRKIDKYKHIIEKLAIRIQNRGNSTLADSSIKLLFDGQQLSVKGGNSKSFPAVSGKPENGKFDFSVKRQKMEKIGPIPEGTYWLDSSELKSLWYYIGKAVESWGSHRITIHPFHSTHTFGRGGFFIHGGTIPGSAGCIDLTSHMEEFANLVSQYTECKIILEVKYP